MKKRVDERTTMFARMNYQPDSDNYKDYYEQHPEHKTIDDELRSMPNLLSEGTSTYHPQVAPFADAGFATLNRIGHLAEGEKASTETDIDPKIMTQRIKEMLKFLGASHVGVCEMKEEFYYSHRGRKKENYGDEVNERYPFAITYAVPMNKEAIDRAPHLEEVLGVVKGYMDAAIIGIWMSEYVRMLGFDARGHVDGNYLVIAPLVAQAAGLGQLGRNGLLVTEDAGQCIRLGVITTTMPLNADTPIDFGLDQVCEVCGKCAKLCPGKAIPNDEKPLEGWKITHENCYKMWRRLGTDCGICIANCPYTEKISEKNRKLMKENPSLIANILRDVQKDCMGIKRREPLKIVR